MLVNVYHDSPAEHRRLVLSGIVFALILALFCWLSIAVYNKQFETVTRVTVKADRAGQQLAKFGDVRLNGVLVGEVRGIDQDGDEAEIELALKPESAEAVPENVEIQILPTTLFGQKYVDLVVPKSPVGEIQDGDVVPSSRVQTNVELSQVLADLFPLLRTVQPAELNYTLSAIARAVQGRGDKIGVTLDKLADYLGVVEDQLPLLRQNLGLLADVADTYADIAPDLLDVLRNATVTGRTVIDSRKQLPVLFQSLAGVANTGARVLETNENDLIRVGEVTEPVLQLLATYSPEFPCLLRGIAKYKPELAATFGGNQVKQYVEIGTPQYPAYSADDRPVFGEVGHGPWCAGLPNAQVPTSGFALDQGSGLDENPPTSPIPGTYQPASGYTGTEADQKVVNALLAGESGKPADEYGALPALMYGPTLRGGGEV